MRAALRRALTWLLVIAAYAALVDLCVETFAAGSSLRWYVLIVSVAFVGVSGLLWRSDRAGATADTPSSSWRRLPRMRAGRSV